MGGTIGIDLCIWKDDSEWLEFAEIVLRDRPGLRGSRSLRRAWTSCDFGEPVDLLLGSLDGRP